MRAKIANVTSIDSPASLRIFYDVTPVPANLRHYDNDAFKKLAGRVSRLRNTVVASRATSDDEDSEAAYDDIHFRLFHRWENAVSKTDPTLLKRLPLEDNVHNAWFSIAMRRDVELCSSVSVNLNQLTHRMFKCVARLTLSCKGEEKTIVKLLLAFFQVYSIVLLHEDCCSLGAALARDRDATETLKSAFAQTLLVLVQRAHRVYRQVPSVLVALALLLRNEPILLEQIDGLISREGERLLPKLMYGSQLLMHPLTVTCPQFMRDNAYTRNDGDLLDHLHVDRDTVNLMADTTLKMQTTSDLDTWFAVWPYDGTKPTLLEINEFMRPLPHTQELTENDNGDGRDSTVWSDAGTVRMRVSLDQTANDARKQDLIVRRVLNNDDSRCSATNEIYICQKSTLFSLSEQTHGLSCAQRFSSRERDVVQEAVINCFVACENPSRQRPTLVLNLLVTSKWLEQPDQAADTYRGNVFVFDLKQLRDVTPLNVGQYHLLGGANDPPTDSLYQRYTTEDEKTTLVPLPAYDANNNLHILQIDDQHERVFVKRNQSNNNVTSVFFRIGQNGELQLVLLQRLDQRVTHQLEDRVTLGFDDLVYGTTTKAFDRKIRNNERLFLQNEVLGYKTLDEYNNSTKRNCLNFMYA